LHYYVSQALAVRDSDYSGILFGKEYYGLKGCFSTEKDFTAQNPRSKFQISLIYSI
jgi:hypothetical protein